jgi:hypothetical protein
VTGSANVSRWCRGQAGRRRWRQLVLGGRCWGRVSNGAGGTGSGPSKVGGGIRQSGADTVGSDTGGYSGLCSSVETIFLGFGTEEYSSVIFIGTKEYSLFSCSGDLVLFISSRRAQQ